MRLGTAYRNGPCHTGRATSRAQHPDAVLAFQERGDRVYKTGGILIHGHMAAARHDFYPGPHNVPLKFLRVNGWHETV